MKRIGLLLFLTLSATGLLFPQVTKVRGKITDATTGEPVSFASVMFVKTTIGTLSQDDGSFFLEERTNADSIAVICVGYKRAAKPIRKGTYQVINFQLEPTVIELQTVTVRPGENPAHILLRKVIANKKRNDQKNMEYYHCEIYTRTQIAINNIDEKFVNKKIFTPFKFMFENLDTNALTGKAYLTVLITESLSDYYYQKDIPRIEREIVKASKTSGVRNESVSQLLARLSHTFNIYDNFMTFFQESGFVSPISDVGLLYYKYRLTDTLVFDGHTCYQVSFRPRRKQERTFSGDMWIVDSVYAIKKIEMKLTDDANLNYIDDLAAIYEYSPYQDSLWMLSKEVFMVDFNLLEKQNSKMKGMFGIKTTYYNNYDFNGPLTKELVALRTNVTVNDSALHRDKNYWDTARPVPLNPREEKVYQMVDSIRKVPLYQTIADIANLIVGYYYVWGPVELGPYFSTFSFNRIEGPRFRLGMRTSNDFSTKLMLDGYVAYGIRDERFKYKIGTLYMFDKNPRRSFGTSYMHDVKQLGQSPYTFRTDNILTSLLRRVPFYKLQMVDKFNSFYEYEWFQGFSNTISANHLRIYPTPYIPFKVKSGTDTLNQPNVIASEICLATHFAYNETFVMGEFERTSLGTKYPVIDLLITTGFKNILGSQYTYQKLNFTLTHWINTNPFGYFKYTLEGGKYFGRLPYPLLELHKGNETYAFDYYAFNMMNYYEFVSDQYASVIAEQHLQGFFLNYFPLMRLLKLREVATFKALYGTLNKQNREVMLLPQGMSDVSRPYLEAGIGIENILKLIRIDFVYRLTHQRPDQPNWGVFMKFQLIL